MKEKYPNPVLLRILASYHHLKLNLNRSIGARRIRAFCAIVGIIGGFICISFISSVKPNKPTLASEKFNSVERKAEYIHGVNVNDKPYESVLKDVIKNNKNAGAAVDPIQELLTDIFKKVDKNKNNLMSSIELERWIKLKIEEHLEQGVNENEEVFKAVDKNNDGKVTWDEYHIFYLISKGVDEKIAEKHLEVHDDLHQRDQEVIVQDKFRWAEADEDDDGVLVVSEFLCFKHPEHSSKMLVHMVRDILNNLDNDGDDKLSPSEFAAMPPGESEAVWMESESKFQAERFREFSTLIDLDRDGFVTFDELLKYTDPKNVQHAKTEADSLVSLSDTNRDGMVSLGEMLKQRELFLGSKVVNVGDVVHDEF